MRGAIIGDIVGSPYEGPLEEPGFDFPLFIAASRFTDDTVCSVAVADAILNDRPFGTSLRDWGRRYPRAGYGEHFARWLGGEIEDGYGSWGNGAPMRVSPCAWLAATEEHALKLAVDSCAPTHNHPDSVAAAQAVVAAIWAARRGKGLDVLPILAQLLLKAAPPSLEALLAGEDSNLKARSTVLRAFAAVGAAGTFEEALRYAIQSGGDTDTTAAIAGSVAEAYFDIPGWMWAEARLRLPADIASISDAVDARRGLARR
jgi:ADP-ribosylglycohydrolase